MVAKSVFEDAADLAAGDCRSYERVLRWRVARLRGLRSPGIGCRRDRQRQRGTRRNRGFQRPGLEGKHVTLIRRTHPVCRPFRPVLTNSAAWVWQFR